MRRGLNIPSTSATATGEMSTDHPSAEAQFESALQTLRENHHRVTEPRKAILRILTREHGPFTAEEMHRRMEKGSCDLVTVYRSLTAMEEINVVRRCDFGDGSYRYEINTGDHHHHHIICRNCHGVQTLDVCVADGLERIARQMGYAKVTHMLEIFGVCPKCQTMPVVG
jgi:Fur family ferric uptake transcriptional regulator